ncbi:MAG: hypothetical protein PHP85_04690 [Gallionella sp.]|nr:hypothetical protein [Gallionella sp.]
MKIFKQSIAMAILGVLSLSAMADDERAVQDPFALVQASVGTAQPAPVSIAPTVRASGGVGQAAPETVLPSPQVALPVTNKTRMTFMDSKLFDVQLGKELESGKEQVEIDIAGRIPLSNIPPRIDKWMVRCAEEGKVELLMSEPAPKTRFIFSLLPMIFNALGSFKSMQEERMFDYIKRYDTKIYYKKDDSGDTWIEKIVLTRRKAN